MPIEFRCVQCQKLLRVSDEAVGKKARCPDCGTIQEVRPGTVDSPFSPPPIGPIDVPLKPDTNQANPFAERQTSSSPFEHSTANPYVSPSAVPQMHGIEVARQKVQSPAMAMIVIGAIMLALQVFGAIAIVGVAALGRPRADEILPNFVSIIIAMAISATMVVGGRKMQRLESYGMAITAAVLAIVPCTPGCCVLTMPFGIWALVVLLDPQVKAAFHSRAFA